jgi:molybdenum cofactor synthesis domain-containing protein
MAITALLHFASSVKVVMTIPPADFAPASTDVRLSAAILVIGDEILSGRTKDRNIGTIAERLGEAGIDLREVRIVSDDECEIIAGLNALRARWGFVFTTGGIGPTHDDITADSVAKAFGVSIAVDARAEAVMRAYYEAKGLELTPARLRMARIPHGATLIANPISSAPGFRIGNVIVMAGVPHIMEAMLTNALTQLPRGIPVQSRTLEVAHPEGEIADLFGAHAVAFPAVAMGSYPQRGADGSLSTQLVLRSPDGGLLQQAFQELAAKLAAQQLTFHLL